VTASPRAQTGPVGVRFALPAAWYELDLDPATRAASLAHLVRRRLGGGSDPDAVAARRELTARLRRSARAAAEGGSTYAALCDHVVAGVPLSASLLVALLPVPRHGPLTPAGLVSLLTATRAAGAVDPAGAPSRPPVRVVELPAGVAARVRSTEPVEGTRTLQVQYLLPVPGATRVAVLTFATPNVAYGEPFEELFDAVARTAAWVG